MLGFFPLQNSHHIHHLTLYCKQEPFVLSHLFTYLLSVWTYGIFFPMVNNSSQYLIILVFESLYKLSLESLWHAY